MVQVYILCTRTEGIWEVTCVGQVDVHKMYGHETYMTAVYRRFQTQREHSRNVVRNAELESGTVVQVMPLAVYVTVGY